MSESALSPVEEANAQLRGKGYSEAQLSAVGVTLRRKALLKGNKIVSPLSDDEDTVLHIVTHCVPTFEALGRRTLTPQELRACLGRQRP